MAKREPRASNDMKRITSEPRRRKRKDRKLCVVRQMPGEQEKHQRHLFFSSVKTLLLNLRQITDKSSARSLHPPIPTRLPLLLCALTGSLLRDRLCLFSRSEKQPSPHNSQRGKEKIHVGDTITVNRFFLHSAAPEASLALFTVAYKVLILPLLTVAYENSV